MEATKLKKGGIYNHFKNKDEIAVEAFDYNYDRVFRRFRKVLAEATTPLEKLYKVVDAYVSFADDPVVKGGGCPIFNTAMDATNSHPQLKRKARLGIEGLLTYIGIKLKDGIKEGVFRTDINVDEVAGLMIMTLEGALVMSQVNDSKEFVDIASRFVKDYIKNNLVQETEITNT